MIEERLLSIRGEADGGGCERGSRAADGSPRLPHPCRHFASSLKSPGAFVVSCLSTPFRVDVRAGVWPLVLQPGC